MNQESPVAADSAATTGADRRRSDGASPPDGGSDHRHRRVFVGPIGGHIGGKHRDRRAQASTASRRSRKVQERLRRFRRSGPRPWRRRVGLPGGRVERPCLGHRHDGRRRLHAHIRPESTSPSIIHPSGEHEGRSDVEGRRCGYRHHGRRRCGGARDTRRGRARSRIDRPEAAFPSRWPRPGRRWGCSSRGHEPRHAERIRSRRRGERRRRRPGGSPGTIAAATAATGPPRPRRPATGSPVGPRSTPAPMTRRRSIPRRTPSATTRSPTARSRRPRARGSAGAGVARARRSGRPPPRATASRSRSPRPRRRAGRAPRRTRSRSKPEVPREGCAPAVRAPAASAEDAAAGRTPSSCPGSPTRSWSSPSTVIATRSRSWRKTSWSSTT